MEAGGRGESVGIGTECIRGNQRGHFWWALDKCPTGVNCKRPASADDADSLFLLFIGC